MTVYVDDMRAPFGRMTMCHMVADTADELLAMADAIGVARKWIQEAGTHQEHFDVSLEKRERAVRAGAKIITHRQCALMCTNRRFTGSLGDPETAEAEWRARRAAEPQRQPA